MKLSQAILFNEPDDKIVLNHSVSLEKVKEFKEKMKALLWYEYSSPQVMGLMAEIEDYKD